MPYHVYTTEGIILEGHAQGDADKYYSIFTRELGLVLATAKSVRKEESKLRFGLSDFSLSTLSFVRGKNSWKIVSARDIENVWNSFHDDTAKRRVAVRILTLVKKLLQGEEKNETLFTSLFDAFGFLKNNRFTPATLRAFEYIAYLRILTILGYVKHDDAYASFIETSVWSTRLLGDALPHTAAMAHEINASLEASHL